MGSGTRIPVRPFSVTEEKSLVSWNRAGEPLKKAVICTGVLGYQLFIEIEGQSLGFSELHLI